MSISSLSQSKNGVNPNSRKLHLHQTRNRNTFYPIQSQFLCVLNKPLRPESVPIYTCKHNQKRGLFRHNTKTTTQTSTAITTQNRQPYHTRSTQIAKQQSPSRTDRLNITNRPKHVTEPSQSIQKVKEVQIFFPFFFFRSKLETVFVLETLDLRSKGIG